MNNGYDVAVGEPPPRANVYDYVIVLARHRWKLVLFVVLGMAAVAAYTAVQPQTYTASATLMPPEQQKGVSFTDLIGKSAGLDLQSLGKNTSAEIFVKMLASRTLADSLISRFDLIERYGYAPGQIELARTQLHSDLEASADHEGMIEITYSAKTGYLSSKREQQEAARFAAAVVNASIDLLDRFNREKNISSARRSREFIGRMKDVKRKEMERAQLAMLQFQRANKAIALDKQVEASVKALAEIEGQVQKTELELKAAQSELTEGTPQVKMLQARLRELAQQRNRVESGATGTAPFALDMRSVPDLAKDYATLKLDLEVATQVYTYLEAQFHQEEVQEARDLPTVSPLDAAVAPQLRSAPRRTVTLMIALPVLLIVGIVGVFVLEALRRQTRSLDPERATALREAMATGRRRRAIVNGGELRN